MKKLIFASAALAAILAASCSEKLPQNVAGPYSEETGDITVSIVPDSQSSTRAVTAYTEAQTYESQVNNVQILVFHNDGKIAAYKNNGTSLSGTISTTVGAKKVWAVINGPVLSAVSTESALKSTIVALSANSTTASSGFVMSGSGSCTVATTGEVTCSFSVSRLVSRVALRSVTNSLPSSYGALTVQRVFLSNVVGNQNLDGTAAATVTWYNQDGRADEGSRNTAHIIDGSTYTASCADLTFKSVSQSVAVGSSYTPSTPLLLYCYPNSSTVAPAGFSSSFSAKRTVLTVVATVGGTLQYYPVVLDDAVLERNKTYTVGLTITGPGSNDPNTPVSKGSISVSLTVSGWTAGATYDEVI